MLSGTDCNNTVNYRICNRAKVPSDYVIARIYTILQHLSKLVDRLLGAVVWGA